MEQNKKGNKRRYWIGAVLVYIATKAKSILALLKFTKIGATFISMFITMGAYALVFPVQFAVGLVVMILIHELGHVIAAKQKGLPVSAPIFIPFLGALITMKRNPRDAVTEAYIAFGGPILGTAGALASFLLGLILQNDLLLVVANIGFFLNLINLMPIHPLDGGRISAAVTRWLWLVGLIGGLFVIIYLQSILFFVIWAMFAWELYQKYVKGKNRRGRADVIKLRVPLEELWASGAIIPGEEHKRELPFDTYSTLEGEQRIRVRWDALGINETISLPKGTQAIIHKVHVVKIEKNLNDTPPLLTVSCQIDYEVHEPDNYYEVPAGKRIGYGVAYAGLAIFLIFMLYAVHIQGIAAIA
ncbi:Zn-dependent protease [Cohnella kolymensis]|uniref:Zn-dependent protease n=1 Tax=Cohnella kolymensis TaxID=1590652 RepID=A0ABR5A917_9BACL|nr:site-2 protease family protein [Cohnella kolymensis]KIL37509.1 Zn-dependent protease [Cohnella kolymensis]